MKLVQICWAGRVNTQACFVNILTDLRYVADGNPAIFLLIIISQCTSLLGFSLTLNIGHSVR